MRCSRKGEGNKNIQNEQMIISRQGGGLKLFFKRANENFSPVGRLKLFFSNTQIRISRQVGGWVEIIFSNEQMRFSRQGVVKKEYSK